MNMTKAAEAASRQAPQLPVAALGLWVAWNLAAFSGLGWFEETADSWRIFELINVHMVGSVATLLALFAASKQASAWIRKPGMVLAGGAVASLGAVLIVVSSPLIWHSQPLFFTGAAIAGVGTTFLFVRCAAWLGAMPPRTSFMRICQAVMVGAAGYGMLSIAPRPVDRILFCCIGITAAVLLVLHPYNKFEDRALAESAHPTAQYRSFLAAVFIFSLAAQFLKGGAYPLDSTDSRLGFNAAMWLVFVMAALSFLLCAVSTKEFGFGRIYQPGSLVIIALLLAIPFAGGAIGPTAVTGICVAAQYVFNLMAWGMAAYIVFQAHGNAMRVFCSANAALTAGSLLGNFATFATTALDIGGVNYVAACLIMALAAVIVAVFVFPESKLEEMLLPIDETALEKEGGEDRFAPWKDAVVALAGERGLSERETQVFGLLARGKTNQQVADMLVLSPYTVRAHTRNIYTKLDVHSRGELSDLVQARVNGEG